jgi:hypothetical protein
MLDGVWVILGVVVLGRSYWHSFIFAAEWPTRGVHFLISASKQVSHPAFGSVLQHLQRAAVMSPVILIDHLIRKHQMRTQLQVVWAIYGVLGMLE